MNKKSILSGAIILVSCLCCLSAAGQSRTQSPPTPRTEPARPMDLPPASSQKESSQISVETADLAITATVTAKELLFEVVPNPTVEFPGRHKRDTVWDAERQNLPRVVEPGVTYRDIGVRLKIVSRFADIERIVAEALGEVPVTDEMQPPDKMLPQPGTLPSATPPQQQPNGREPQ